MKLKFWSQCFCDRMILSIRRCCSFSNLEKMTRHVDLLSKPLSTAHFVRNFSIFLFAKSTSTWVVGELHYVLHDPQVSITRASPPFFHPPLRPFFPSVSDNSERSLFPENDYADWKVREDLAVRFEMKGEMRLREASHVPRKKSITEQK